MGKRGVVMLMAVVAVSAAVCCSLNAHLSNYKQAFSSDQTGPGDADRNLVESARNTAAKVKDSVNSAASKVSQYTSEKTGEAANQAFETASDLKDVASDKMDQVIRMVGPNQGRETLEKAMEYGKEKVSGAYDEMRAINDSRLRVSEAYDSAKNLMNEEAKATYESAKEKLSEATGAVGDKMRNDKEEL